MTIGHVSFLDENEEILEAAWTMKKDSGARGENDILKFEHCLKLKTARNELLILTVDREYTFPKKIEKRQDGGHYKSNPQDGTAVDIWWPRTNTQGNWEGKSLFCTMGYLLIEDLPRDEQAPKPPFDESRTLASTDTRPSNSSKTAQPDEHALKEGAASVRREAVVLTRGAFPHGDIGDALRKLTPDELQIVNLRLSTNAKGKRLSWREVAQQFRSKTKSGKEYTDERCRQIHENALVEYPALVEYLDGLAKKKKMKLERPNTDKEDIEEMTSHSEYDFNDDFRITNNPRRPLNLPNSDR